MSLLLHISDPHFGTEMPPVVEALRQVARDLRPDVVVLSGDITQRARTAQFAVARQFCDSLHVPHVLTLPGNHDIPLYNLWARVFNPYGGYRAAFGDELEPELDLDDLLVLCVNTTRPSRHKDGEVSKAQIERVARRLEGARREQLRIVVTHQPACVMREEDEKDRLHGGHRAVQAWSKAGADLVLGGHIHLPYLSDLCARVKGTQRTMFCLQAGTAVSHRVRFGTPNSINVLRWSAPAAELPRECTAQRWDYDLADQRFELTHNHDLKLAE
ncbi:metallophosphoesterase family protein [Ramlibacter sp. Leaf400]|uniref:metallophosphoesterase family protein n=1 Tax=Ramlibacter sp. Leaf400 TaxID=1736365 RepID=UPI0006F9168A|nr:metallophosphoesterase [Ramlibacter sp. Leaf400]KQT07631.1 DNA repair exonuclease [Ramlibacter sp. Leaf400]